MFGYVMPQTDELRVKEHVFYKSVYCGLCKCMGKYVCAESRMNPNHIFSLIRLDIEKALLNTDFTMQQINVLNKILSSNEKLTRPEFKVFYRACERISNFLTNNG